MAKCNRPLTHSSKKNTHFWAPLSTSYLVVLLLPPVSMSKPIHKYATGATAVVTNCTADNSSGEFTKKKKYTHKIYM